MRLQTAFLAILLTTLSYSKALKIYQAEATIGYEQWKLPKDEILGITRVGVLFNIAPWWYSGLNIYGATKGKRGGFFTLGFDNGLQTNQKLPLSLRAGLFVGAGGGGSAPQGGGLMLRPYLEIKYNRPNYSISSGISYVSFPNGKIESTQLFGAIYIPFNGKYWNGWPKVLDFKETKSYKIESTIRAGEYITSSSAKTTNGKKLENMKWLGVELHKYFNKSVYFTLSSIAAGGGNTDGYMELFGGIGYKFPFGTLPIYSYFQTELGMGGGGKIDSAGGSMWRVRSGIGAKVFKNYTIGIDSSYTKSFKGTFEAKSIGVFFGIDSKIGGDKDSLKPALLSIRALNKTHFSSKGDFKNPNRADRIDMLGIALDYYFNRHFFVTGQALWAYKGHSGGYAEGLLGLGWQSSAWHNMKLWTEALIGAGGGGGVKTDGGLLGSISVGTSFKIKEGLDLTIGVGYTKSSNKGLSCIDATAGLRYRFTIP